jgi:peptide chain release factor 1
MLEKLEILESRYVELEQQLSDPAVLADIDEYRKYAKKHGELSEIVSTFREFKDICKEMEDTRSLFDEDLEEELLGLAETDLSELEEKKGQLEEKLKFLLLPRDPRDKKNVIVEIRAGTGGDEAALFASDLFRMYSYYAERQGWKVEVLDSHPTDMGGYKEIIFQVNGNYVFSKLKFESGAHRVQRIPVTESGLPLLFFGLLVSRLCPPLLAAELLILGVITQAAIPLNYSRPRDLFYLPEK